MNKIIVPKWIIGTRTGYQSAALVYSRSMLKLLHTFYTKQEDMCFNLHTSKINGLHTLISSLVTNCCHKVLCTKIHKLCLKILLLLNKIPKEVF